MTKQKNSFLLASVNTAKLCPEVGLRTEELRGIFQCWPRHQSAFV